jgi:GR25 family glycosyltransferase involved in LPS biosynthesis
MNNPLASSGGIGFFSAHSRKNRNQDLEKIQDLKSYSTIASNNKCKFPTDVRVINLEKRPDRWEKFQELNTELFSKFSVTRFNAIEGNNVVDAIFNSFTSCLEESFKDHETVIIMEDDCYLAPGGLEKLKSAFLDLPEDWDCLIGNHYFISGIEILTDHLARPKNQASTLNFAVFRNTILNKIKDNLDLRSNFLRDIDHFITSEEVPINNYTVWPMISREYVSHSDHKNSVKDMTNRIRENAFLYQFVDSDTYYPSIPEW